MTKFFQKCTLTHVFGKHFVKPSHRFYCTLKKLLWINELIWRNFFCWEYINFSFYPTVWEELLQKFQNGKLTSKNEFLNFNANDSSDESQGFSLYENSSFRGKFWHFCNNFLASKLTKIAKFTKNCIFSLVTKIFEPKIALQMSCLVNLQTNFKSYGKVETKF